MGIQNIDALEKYKEEDRLKTMSTIIEGLRGEAAQVAMDLGLEALEGKEALDKLLEAMRNQVYPMAQAEAKELYRVGHKVRGVMSRQPGESMASYVARRRRWWALLKSLDSALELSASIRGDLMLEAANLPIIEQLLVLTSTKNDHDFDVIATALIDQHAKIHMGEKVANKEHKPFS